MDLPYQKCQQELRELLLAQYPLIFLRSSEESRAIQCAIASHNSLVTDIGIPNGEIARWSSIEAFQKLTAKPNDPSKVNWQRLGNPLNPQEDPVVQSLKFLQQRLQEMQDQLTKQGNLPENERKNAQHTYLLPDWSSLIDPNSHLTARYLKELVIAIDQKRPRLRMSLIIVGADWSIPPTLRNCVHIVDLPLPIGQELYEDIFSLAIDKYDISEDVARRLSEQAQGMSLQAAAQTARLTSARELWGQPDEAGKLLLEVKKQEIRKTGVLEYYAPQGNGLNDVGGLENIKAWVASRQEWFEQDNKPELRPRAILLEGFPGCGKSFIAKAIAQQWRVPQINFEIARLQSKWVGESESKTHQALRAIEASAPNILFMDEIEKAFSGVGGDSSGVTTRQFGTFLSWLNDHAYPIFFIATSNDRSQLPPELFRAGRFDEVFIVMPPTWAERYEIIQKRSEIYGIYDLSEFDLEFLVENTGGFTGAELDKLVREVIYITGLNNEPSATDWQQALALIKPQYRTDRMQHLLQKYKELLSDGGGKPASAIEEGFLDSLILPQNNV